MEDEKSEQNEKKESKVVAWIKEHKSQIALGAWGTALVGGLALIGVGVAKHATKYNKELDFNQNPFNADTASPQALDKAIEAQEDLVDVLNLELAEMKLAKENRPVTTEAPNPFNN